MTLVGRTCELDLTAYDLTIDFPTGATITSTEGAFDGVNAIIGIPADTDVEIVSTLNGCSDTLNVTAPDCTCPDIAPPVSGGDEEICEGEEIEPLTVTVSADTLTADWYTTPTGGTAIAVATLMFTPDVTMPGTYNYYVETRDPATECTSDARTLETLIIDALPTIDIDPVDPVCVDAEPVTLSATPEGGTFSGGGVAGDATSGFTFDPSEGGVGMDRVFYTFTDGNGCTAVDSLTIEVIDLPVLSIDLVADLCVDADAVPLVGNPAGGNFSGPGVAGTTFDPVLTDGAGDYTITYSYTDPMTGCNNTVDSVITVLPLPEPMITPIPEICVDAGAQNLTADLPGGTFRGAGVDGTTFDPAVAGVGRDTVFYDYTDPVTGCMATALTVIIVDALPTVTIEMVDELCPEDEPVALVGEPVGGTFSGAGVVGSMFDPSAVAPDGTYPVTYTFTDGNGCMASATMEVTVFPAAMASIEPVDPLCENGEPITLVGMPAGGVFEGEGVNADVFDPSAVGPGTFTKFYDFEDANGCTDTASIEIIVQELPSVVFDEVSEECEDVTMVALSASPEGGTFSGPGVTGDNFDPSSVGAGNYELIYTFTDLATGCTNSDTATAIVDALPTLTVDAIDDVCEDGDPIALIGNPVGGTFSGMGVNAAGDEFDPTAVAPGTYTLTYTFTDDNGCTNTTDATVTVNELPDVVIEEVDPLCSNDASVLLRGTPLGGFFSGPGVVGNRFDPSASGAGTFQVIYTETDPVTGCTSADTTMVVVNELPEIVFEDLGDVCLNDGPTDLTAQPAGGTFSGIGVIDNQLDPQVAGVGDVTLTYTVTDPATGCTNSGTTTITVVPLPELTFVPPTGLCPDDDPVLLVATPAGGTFSGPGILMGTTFDPGVNGGGEYDVTYTFTDDDTGCTNTVTVMIVVRDECDLVNATVAQNDINQTPQATPVSGNLLTNDFDVEGDDQVVTLPVFDTDGDGMVDDTILLGTVATVFGTNTDGVLVEAGTITVADDGAYTFSPNDTFLGKVRGGYTVLDDNDDPAIDDATLLITVFGGDIPGVPQPPIAINDIRTTEVNTPLDGNIVERNDADPENQVLTVTMIMGDSNGDGTNNESLEVGVPADVFGKEAISCDTIPAGTITINMDGSYVYTPALDFTGTVNVDYEILDEDGFTDMANLSIKIQPNNGNNTFANDDTNNGPFTRDQVGNLLTNDSDPEDDGFTVTSAEDSQGNPIMIGTPFTLPSGGTLTIQPGGEYVYNPLFGFVGTEVVPYTTTDDNPGGPAMDMATLYLTTFPAPNATVAQNDINQTPQGVPVDGNLLTNDSDAEGDDQTVSDPLFDTDGDGMANDPIAFNSPVLVFGTDTSGMTVEAGTIELDMDGSYTFTPNEVFLGEVPGAYTALDDNMNPATDPATLDIAVIGDDIPGVPQPPIALNDIRTTEENTSLTDNVVEFNDSDPEDQELTVTVVLGDTDGDGMNNDPIMVGTTTPVFGKEAISCDTIPAGTIVIIDNGGFTYVPAMDFTGTVNVDYEITDEDNLTDEANLSIKIQPDDGNNTFANDDANSGPFTEDQDGNILDDDFDPEGDEQTVTGAFDSDGNAITIGTSYTLPSGGTLTIEEDGEYVYTPMFGFVGTEVVPYTVTDDNTDDPATDMATLYLTTFPTPNATVAQNDINQTPQGVPVDGNLLTNDSDAEGDDQTVSDPLFDTDGDGMADDPIAVNTTFPTPIHCSIRTGRWYGGRSDCVQPRTGVWYGYQRYDRRSRNH